jgi:hypothetical protein
LPLVFWALAAALVVFAAWCVWAITDTRAVRGDIEATVNALGAVQEVRSRLDRLGAEPASSLSADEWRTLEGRVGEVRQAMTGRGIPADLAVEARAVEEQLGEVEHGPAAGSTAARRALFQGMDRLTVDLRRRSRELSVVIARHLDRLNAITGAAFVFGTATLLLLAVAHRRRLRAEEGEHALARHHDLLHAAATRWAGGDLGTALVPPEGAEATIEHALEEVRRSLVAKLAEIETLNESLSHQIRERSAQLSEALARLDGKRELTAMPAIGVLFAGRYEILDRLGEGGMGTVFRVKRTSDQLLCALKILHAEGSELVRTRFLREAHLLTQIRHPNVVAIHDVGVSPAGELYLVTELVLGKNLGEHTPWKSPEEALPVLAAVASGLAAVHARGIVHRDLKPANIVVTTDADGSPKVVKLLDFGIARAVDPAEPPPVRLTLPVLSASSEAEPALTPLGAAKVASEATSPHSPSPGASSAHSASTQHGMLVGTPRYIAPEVALEGGRVTPAADVFAFGVTAYRLLTGEMPFRESPARLILHRAALPPPRPLAERCPTLPPPAAELLMRCLAEDPSARPSAEELARGLAAPSA